jgi:hypothetical protein
MSDTLISCLFVVLVVALVGVLLMALSPVFVHVFEWWCDLVDDWVDQLREWREARRGRK